MLSKVLIPFDFSDDSYYAIKCITRIPEIREVILLHVIYNVHLIKSTDTINPDADYARLRMEEVKNSIDLPRSRVKILIEEITGGEISDIIQRVAEAEDASLIVMGRRGRSIIETILIGSTASDILRYGTKDLLLIHPPDKQDGEIKRTPCPPLLSHVMICTDFSSPDINHLAFEGLPPFGRVSLLHVITKGDTHDQIGVAREEAEKELKSMEEPYARRNIQVQSHIRIGDAAKEIAGYAKDHDVSLILLKSTGRRGLIKNLLGSTTDAVTRLVDKPVLIFKR